MISSFKTTIVGGLLAAAISFGFAQSAWATHVPLSSTLADYKGQLKLPNVFDEITLDGEYDWFSFKTIIGQKVTFNVDRGDTGNLLPNLHVYTGITTNGTSLGTSGLVQIFGTSNSGNANLMSMFTPTIDGWHTAIVSTWTGQQGTYDLAYEGTVPEPGTLALFGLGLAGLGFARRKKAA